MTALPEVSPARLPQPEPLVLASGSRVRADLLRAAGLAIAIDPADVDERAIEARHRAIGATPEAIAALLAEAKALAVSARRPGALVVGADQVLALGERRFSKPANREAARRHLQDLSGRTHALHSGVALVRDGAVLFRTVATARLTMRELDDAALDAYLDGAGDAVLTSVGAYQLEGLGVHLMEAVEGDHFTVLGLPMLPLLSALRRLGVGLP